MAARDFQSVAHAADLSQPTQKHREADRLIAVGRQLAANGSGTGDLLISIVRNLGQFSSWMPNFVGHAILLLPAVSGQARRMKRFFDSGQISEVPTFQFTANNSDENPRLACFRTFGRELFLGYPAIFAVLIAQDDEDTIRIPPASQLAYNLLFHVVLPFKHDISHADVAGQHARQQSLQHLLNRPLFEKKYQCHDSGSAPARSPSLHRRPILSPSSMYVLICSSS